MIRIRPLVSGALLALVSSACIVLVAGCRLGGRISSGDDRCSVGKSDVKKAVHRGYGAVTALFGEEAVFVCESRERALVLYSKLRKDLLESGTTAPVTEGNLWRLAGGTYGAVGISGNEVHAVSSTNRDEVARKVADLGLIFPTASHPKYLDYYDHNAFRFYTKTHSPGRWEFVKSLGAGGMGYQDPSIIESPAEGVLSFVDSDAAVGEAERHDGMLVLGPCIGGSLPLWMRNKDPEKMAKVQPSLVYSGWTPSVNAAAFESGALWDGATSPIIAMQRLIMERYGANRALGGWHLNRGQPVGDNLGVLMNGCLWDASEEGKAAYIDYLKKRYGLADLGMRWYGDSKHFASWGDVKPVDVTDLLGGSYDTERVLLSGRTWFWRKSKASESGMPAAAEGPWLRVEMLPSHRCVLLDSGSAYYKTSFQLPEAMVHRVAESLFLKMLLYMYQSNRVHVWVNGTYVPSEPVNSSEMKLHGVKLPPGILYADRENEVVIQTPDGRSDGRIHGPVSISALPPDNYPFKDERINAQYLDAYDFQMEAVVRRITQMVRYARQFDPDRPMVLSGGSWDSLALLMPMMKTYGVGFQYTGCEGALNPQFAGIASIFDSYYSGEPTASVLNEQNLDRMLGMMYFLGTSTFDMFMSVDEYMDFDRKTGALSKRKDLLKLYGKYLVDHPNTAMFWSSVPLLDGAAIWNWNLDRGEIQSAHYDADHLNEQALEAGAGSRYDVVIDCGNTVLSDEAISDLRRYVEGGGTYVVLPPTGRHGRMKANSMPIEPLSGFKVVERGVSGAITFARQPTVFGFWAGKTFNGDGVAFDWKNNSIVGDSGIVLQPSAPGTEAIATWEKGGIAIGLRRLGKGRVVTLGSTFWRNGRDTNGKSLPSSRNVLFEQLLDGLGCKRTAMADSDRIWTRNAVTKNGQENWMIAVNIAENEPFVITSDLAFQLDFAPSRIVDRVTGQDVAFTVSDKNQVTIPKVAFTKYQTRIFAAARPLPLAESLKTWWNEKVKYWHAAPQESLPVPRDSAPAAMSIDTWRFAEDRDGQISKGGVWNTVSFDDGTWINLPSGSWKELDARLADYGGIGLYRRTFAIPKSWTGVVTLNFKSPLASESADVYVNGVQVALSSIANSGYPGPRSFDITGLLDRAVKNVLAVAVKGGRNRSGICYPVWIAHEKKLSPVIDLNGEWKAIKGDQMITFTTSVPGKTRARFLRKTVEVPRDWAGRTVYFHLETPSIWCGVVVVNGQMRTLDHSNTPFGTRVEINITDLFKSGASNTVELWHWQTAGPNWRGGSWGWSTENELPVTDVRIGCEAD